MRTFLPLVAALLTACGGDSYRWYCDQLNTTPSTWVLREDRCRIGPTLTLRLDVHGAPQSCGAGCSCVLSGWQHGERDVENRYLLQETQETCGASITCTIDGSSYRGALSAHGPDLDGFLTKAGSSNQCDYYLGTPVAP